MAGLNPPPYLNIDEDRGAIVAVVSFTTIAVSTFTNTIRVWTRQKSEAALGLDDVLLIAANVSTTAERILSTLLMARFSVDYSYRTDRSGRQECQ
jgi:hypothetical protein